MNRIALSTFVLLSAGSAAMADGIGLGWLPADAISKALTGKTIEGRYANGQAFTESYGTDGRVEYIENGRTIGGHWSVTAGTLCTIYDADASGGCFRINRPSANCFEFYFAARTEEAAPGPEGNKPLWTARGSISGENTACQDGANV